MNAQCDTNSNTKYQAQCVQNPGTDLATKVFYADDDTECKNPSFFLSSSTGLCSTTGSRVKINCSVATGYTLWNYVNGCDKEPVKAISYELGKCVSDGGLRVKYMCGFSDSSHVFISLSTIMFLLVLLL